MPTVDFDVNLTQEELVLPEYDFNTRWNLTGVNRRSIVVPIHLPNDVYYRLEYAFVCKDVDTDTEWNPMDSRYDDLAFGIWFYNGNARLAVRTLSGMDYGTTLFYYGVALYQQDGDLDTAPYINYNASWVTLANLNGAWHDLYGLNVSPYNADAASTIMQNKIAYEEGYSIYRLEEIPAGSIVGNDTAGALSIISPIAVNGNVIDPEEYGETSGPGGGVGGSFDNSSDAVDFAALPTGGAAASGLITMFAPTAAQLQAFGNFLWTTLFDAGFDSLLTSLKKWVNDPVESVIQLAAFPVTPPAGSAQVVKFCGIASDLVGTGVSMNKCTSQFMDFDFGQLTTPAYWKQTLDYSPYTQVSIYLPFIGICPLKSDDVIDATLHLKYHIDLLTGGFSAELKCTKNINGTPLNSVLYNWSGNMATQIPITSANFSQVFGSMMTAVAAIGVGAITGGMGAAAAGTGAEAASSSAVMGGALSGAGHGLAANIGNVINSKPHVTKSGRLDGTVGALSQFTPYLIIERPVQSLSAKFQEEQGYPSNIVQRLGDLSGMTVCEAPIMTGFSGATEEEKEAIRAMLCEGVIL